MPPKERKESLLDPRIFQHHSVVFYGEDPTQAALSAQPVMIEESPNSWNIVWSHCNKVKGAIMYVSGNTNFNSGILVQTNYGYMDHIPVNTQLLSVPLRSGSFALPNSDPAMFIYRPNAQDLSLFITPNVLDYDPRIWQRMAQQLPKIDYQFQRYANTNMQLLDLMLSRHTGILENAFKVNADQKTNNNWGHK